MAGRGLASRLRDRIRIERPVSDDSFDGAGAGSWALVSSNVPAEVKDTLSGGGERTEGGIKVATRTARVLIRWRAGMAPNMRFVMGDRIMQITAGPAEPAQFGRREALEFLVEDYSTAGGGA
jgi:head-tail adaptor